MDIKVCIIPVGSEWAVSLFKTDDGLLLAGTADREHAEKSCQKIARFLEVPFVCPPQTSQV